MNDFSPRQRPYTLPGKCITVPDTICRIGSSYFCDKIRQDVLEQIKFADLFGKRNRCNDGFRCAECLADQDCPTREVSMMMRLVRMVIGDLHYNCVGDQKQRN